MSQVMRISRNDPTLASAVGKAIRNAAATEQLTKARTALNSGKSLKTALKAFGDNIVFQHTEKAHGDRCRWALVVALHTPTGILLVLIGRWRADKLLRPLAFVTGHAIDRCLQRTICRGDLSAIKEAIYPQLSVLAKQFFDHGPDAYAGSVKLISAHGALLGQVEEGCLIFKTWVDAETCADPEIRLLARAVGGDVAVVGGGERV